MVPGHPDPTAVMGRRYLAFIIDDILLTVVVGIVAALTVQYTEVPFGLSCSSLRNSALCFSNGNTTYLVDQADLVWVYVAWGVYVVLVFWLLQGLTGASPGKAICGIRTVRADGRPCGVGRAVVRSVLLVVDLIGCVVPLVGPITAGTSKGHKRVGDMAGGTFVVGKTAVGSPVFVPGAAAPAAAPVYGAPPAYGAPVAGPQAAPIAPVGPAAGAAGAAPAPDAQWDPQRGTWVRWDGAQWTAHDPASGSWLPI